MSGHTKETEGAEDEGPCANGGGGICGHLGGDRAHAHGHRGDAVVIGVVCGVVAGIPTSLLVVAVTTHRTGERVRAQPRREYPPVAVIQPGQASSAYAQLAYLAPMRPTAGARNLHVVGEEIGAIPGDWERLY